MSGLSPPTVVSRMMAIRQLAIPINLLALKAVNSYAVTAHLTLAISNRTVQIMKSNLSKLRVTITVNQLLAPFSIQRWLHKETRQKDIACIHWPLHLMVTTLKPIGSCLGSMLTTEVLVLVVLMDITNVLLKLYCLFLLQIILHCDCM